MEGRHANVDSAVPLLQLHRDIQGRPALRGVLLVDDRVWTLLLLSAIERLLAAKAPQGDRATQRLCRALLPCARKPVHAVLHLPADHAAYGHGVRNHGHISVGQFEPSGRLAQAAGGDRRSRHRLGKPGALPPRMGAVSMAAAVRRAVVPIRKSDARVVLSEQSGKVRLAQRHAVCAAQGAVRAAPPEAVAGSPKGVPEDAPMRDRAGMRRRRSRVVPRRGAPRQVRVQPSSPAYVLRARHDFRAAAQPRPGHVGLVVRWLSWDDGSQQSGTLCVPDASNRSDDWDASAPGLSRIRF